MSRTLLLTALCAALSPTLHAGEALPPPGAKVRLLTEPGPILSSDRTHYRVEGRLVRQNADSITLASGDTVVTYAKPGRWLTGRLLAIEPDWLLVAGSNDAEPWRVPREAMTRFQVGNNRSRLHGVLKGAGVGLLAGAALGFASGDDPPGLFALTAGDKALVFGTLGVAVGSVVGLVRGSTRWEVVDTHGFRMSVAPAGTGAQVRLDF